MKKTYIGIIRDHSVSMNSISKSAMTDYNTLIADIRKNSIDHDLDTIVSVVECGVSNGWNVTTNELVVKNSSVLGLKPMTSYNCTGNSTPLFDAVGMLIDSMMDVPDAADPEVAFLITVVTDGGENSSTKYQCSLAETIQKLQRTDRWSFAFRVPRGYKRHMTGLGIPSGNVLEWDTTEEGMVESTVFASQATDSYFSARAAGQTSTKSFYSTDMTNVSAQKVKNSLVDITSEVSKFYVAPADSGIQIREFVERHVPSMKKGSAFYQLTKKEDEVQDYKQILIREKKNGKIYGGVHARQILGLPFSGTVKIVPGNHGNYDIFIQSTSVNRKLVGGTNVLYWDKIGEEYKEPKAVSKKVIAPKPGFVDPKQEYIRGYIAGFDDGKAKNDRSNLVVAYSSEYAKGYEEGYKNGRGKKKRLYTSADLT